MQLQAKRPPGRTDRKAGAFASEIVRMRAEGYTYPAILEALKGVGVTTTERSLRREVRRPQKHLIPNASNALLRPGPNPLHTPPATPNAMASEPAPSMTTAAPGREVAEAFFNAHPSNPLFQSLESS